MILSRTSAAVAIVLLLGPGLAPSARAQTPPPYARLVGAEVKDSKGKSVGRVERVINGPDGKPVQALVRVDRILRTLPMEALTSSSDSYVSVLSRAEIAALPPSE
jgi:sporulation protein YlmC with PRC-barrel domain